MFQNNKQKFTKEDRTFFENVTSKLPVQYNFLRDQIVDEFILGKKENVLGTPGGCVLLLNANLESKYINKSLPNFFILKDIGVWHKIKKKYEFIELDILQGMFAGYMLKSKITDLDSDLVNVSQIKEKHFFDEDKVTLNRIIGKINNHTLSMLDINGTFKIELPEGEHYVVKDLGDGNYLTTNRQGAVFMLIHDPYKVEKIFDDFHSFTDAIESKHFDIQKYYESCIQ